MIDFGDNDGLLWPTVGDDPFLVTGKNPHAVAAVNQGPEPWVVYAEGFRRHADLAVEHVIATQRDHNFLVYPVGFSYRHYIELSLKLIIRDAQQLLDKPVKVADKHNLTDLWNATEYLMREVEPDAVDDFPAVRAALARFSEADPKGESFRYPTLKDGAPSLPETLRLLDLVELRDVVGRLDSFFWACRQQIAVYADYKSEMAVDLAPDEW
jgi:hypothetical protein